MSSNIHKQEDRDLGFSSSVVPAYVRRPTVNTQLLLHILPDSRLEIKGKCHYVYTHNPCRRPTRK